MSEINEGSEQLSEEELTTQVNELLSALSPYNNLKAAVLANQHVVLAMIDNDPSLLEGDDAESQEFRETTEKFQKFSSELREEMANVGLRAEDGHALRDIMIRRERRVADLVFLQEYLPKMQSLYKKLHYKNGVDGEIRWDQQTLGTIFEEGKN